MDDLGYLTIIRNEDGSHTGVTHSGQHLTVPAGAILPAAAYVELIFAPFASAATTIDE